MKSFLFRKQAGEQLSQSNRTDTPVHVTNPGIWTLLIASIAVVIAFVVWIAVSSIPDKVSMTGIVFPGDGAISVLSTVDGQIHDIRFEVGDFVYPQDILAVVPQWAITSEMEALSNSGQLDDELREQMRHNYVSSSIIRSHVYGVVLDSKRMNDIVAVNDQIMSIARLEEGTNTYEVLCYVTLDVARRLELGMEVEVTPSYVSREEYGYMYGYVSKIGTHPVTDNDILSSVGNMKYVADILDETSNRYEIKVALQLNPAKEGHNNAALWSNDRGNSLDLVIGTVCDLSVIVREHSLFDLFLGNE